MTEYYQYSPLEGDCIRLLEILPTEGESIKCRLHVYRLNVSSARNKVSLVALSYTWGSPRDVREITLDGKIFVVRNNLWLALQTIKTLQARATDPNSVSSRIFTTYCR
jgi:hypothetical protein